MLTDNEKNVLKLLFTAFDEDYSINNIAKKCNLSPNGAAKILNKFEKQGILKPKNIANIKSYKINFENEKTVIILELTLIPKLEKRIKYRLDDLNELKEITKTCIIFGSYTNMNKKPNDLDALFVLDKNNFEKYKKKLSNLREIMPVKIHDVLQTEEDLKHNIIQKDKIILDILKTGIILWGQKTIIEVIKDVYKR
ncbi:MAG: winged helix-turn-helix transcriptional regulator [Nanoarchaeota archaeon]|nr:winged helix-turn-helix transcriptional regulator [Nanoarchaeota archaeon]